MLLQYCFSSEQGDLPADPATLQRPFLLGLSEPHPCLTLQDYFNAIRQVVLLSLYRQENDQDLPLIEANAGIHTKELYNIIRRFPG